MSDHVDLIKVSAEKASKKATNWAPPAALIDTCVCPSGDDQCDGYGVRFIAVFIASNCRHIACCGVARLRPRRGSGPTWDANTRSAIQESHAHRRRAIAGLVGDIDASAVAAVEEDICKPGEAAAVVDGDGIVFVVGPIKKQPSSRGQRSETRFVPVAESYTLYVLACSRPLSSSCPMLSGPSPIGASNTKRSWPTLVNTSKKLLGSIPRHGRLAFEENKVAVIGQQRRPRRKVRTQAIVA